MYSDGELGIRKAN